jgi:hypothetical protein
VVFPVERVNDPLYTRVESTVARLCWYIKHLCNELCSVTLRSSANVFCKTRPADMQQQ